MAIKERSIVACKKMLTDLKCRVDSNCIHVNGSSCHPGTGYCSCPSSTIYVPELHECRIQIVNSYDKKCLACRSLNGICYSTDHARGFNKMSLENHTNIGCVCPEDVVKKYQSSDDSSILEICGKQLSDLNEYCNNYDYVCRSKKANCLANTFEGGERSPKPSLTNDLAPQKTIEGICQCPRNHVGVYQRNLKYYECFPTLTDQIAQCKKCIETGGSCYDSNSDGSPDGCVCPNYSSNKFSERDLQLESPCSIKHLLIQCTRDNILLCYKPHWKEPYESLSTRLYGPNATAHVQLRMNNDFGLGDESCRLLPTDSIKNSAAFSNVSIGQIPNDIKYCRKFDLTHDPDNHLDKCGIRRTLIKNQRMLLEATVDVHISREKEVKLYSSRLEAFRLPADLTIVSSCITPISEENKNILINESKQQHQRYGLIDESKVVLKIIDAKTHQQIRTITKGSVIQIDISANHLFEVYQSIRVDTCYANNQTDMRSAVPIMPKQCESLHHYESYLSPITRFDKIEDYPLHLLSNQFPAFRLGDLSSVFFSCEIQLCPRLSEDCNSPKQSCERSESHGRQNLLKKMVHIEVLLDQRVLLKKNAHEFDSKSRVCRFAICLTSSQMGIVAFLLLLLFISITILLGFLYRRMFRSKHCQPLRPNPDRMNRHGNMLLKSTMNPSDLTLLKASPDKKPLYSLSSQLSTIQHQNYANSLFLSTPHRNPLCSPKFVHALGDRSKNVQTPPMVYQTLGRPRNLSLILNNSRNHYTNESDFALDPMQNVISNNFEIDQNPSGHMFMQMNSEKRSPVEETNKVDSMNTSINYPNISRIFET